MKRDLRARLCSLFSLFLGFSFSTSLSHNLKSSLHSVGWSLMMNKTRLLALCHSFSTSIAGSFFSSNPSLVKMMLPSFCSRGSLFCSLRSIHLENRLLSFSLYVLILLFCCFPFFASAQKVKRELFSFHRHLRNLDYLY